MLSPVGTMTGTVLDVVIVSVVGYLVGSIPIAGIVARRNGVADLRDVGDHNPGFWNAREAIGVRGAIPIFIGDVAKGALPAACALLLADDGVWGLAYVATGAAMVGHAVPLFAGFHGGRSVLTFVGGATVFAPVPSAIALAVLLLSFAVTRSLAWGARAAIVAFPVAQLLVEGPNRTAATGVLMTFIGVRFIIGRRGPATPDESPA